MNYDDALAWLVRYMEDIQYYNTYPSRRYHLDTLASSLSNKEKLRRLVSDGLVQTELYGDVLSSIDMHADALEYFEKHVQFE